MRFPNYNPRLGVAENRRLAADLIREGGSERRPQAPRSIIAQPGSRGFQLSWSLPPIFRDISGWRVYADSESNLIGEISDRGTRQYFVESTGGQTPTRRAVYVSAINAYGRESNKIQVISKAGTETSVTTPPTNPGSPPGYSNERSGGADRTVRDRSRLRAL